MSYSIDQNPHKGNRGILRAWRAAINSWNGLVFAYQEESAFRQELCLAAILLPLALILPVDTVERILMIGSVALILLVELLNSSIEAAIDRISFEHHALSKRAKDFGSAAVMIALLLCIFTWSMITYPLLKNLS